MTKEPGPMCAMGLLHSRFARVFYGCADEQAGVLGSRLYLHELKSVNHRYKVFRGVIPEVCERLYSQSLSADTANGYRCKDKGDSRGSFT